MTSKNEAEIPKGTVQVNFRPSPELLADLELYRKEMNYKSIPQAVYTLVSEGVRNKLKEMGLK